MKEDNFYLPPCRPQMQKTKHIKNHSERLKRSGSAKVSQHRDSIETLYFPSRKLRGEVVTVLLDGGCNTNTLS